MSTPIYDELESKWLDVNYDKHICDTYWRVYQPQTGQEWYEDAEGNEVFPESPTVITWDMAKECEDSFIGVHKEFAKGGLVKYPAKSMSDAFDRDCGTKRHTPKFKLFGRNQGTRGTV